MTPRIAIIGSGMAGLAAARLLADQEVHVTIYEKAPVPGLAAHSRDFGGLFRSSEPVMGDVPSRMINSELWPGVCEVYGGTGIVMTDVDVSQTFYDTGGVRFRARLPYPSGGPITSILKPSQLIILKQLHRLRDAGNAFLEESSSPDASFGDFLEEHFTSPGSRKFLKRFLFPALTATVFTCPVESLKQYPAHMVLDALQKIASDSLLWRTSAGSGDAAAKMLMHVDDFRFSTPVNEVTEVAGGVSVVSAESKEVFDHVIVATQANHVSSFITDRPEDTGLLDRFTYTDVPVTLHTDSSLMPAATKDWATFNFNSDLEQPCCTVWMNRFHREWPEGPDVFQSIFPGQVDPESVIAQAVLQRPIVNAETGELWRKLDELHAEKDRKIWYVGSYAASGVPLLESACRSSQEVVGRIVDSISELVSTTD